ncbi:hypothetical protein Tcan_04113 [Toxocara canis]|uniref:Uncharacterized protein n=1 Tax=Toxocara canis TaxID=6265 RepID=A0A0B2VLL1_TOXCA|nr:hypothetical protein Tcan_04113 [Toxocara canis]
MRWHENETVTSIGNGSSLPWRREQQPHIDHGENGKLTETPSYSGKGRGVPFQKRLRNMVPNVSGRIRLSFRVARMMYNGQTRESAASTMRIRLAKPVLFFFRDREPPTVSCKRRTRKDLKNIGCTRMVIG